MLFDMTYIFSFEKQFFVCYWMAGITIYHFVVIFTSIENFLSNVFLFLIIFNTILSILSSKYIHISLSLYRVMLFFLLFIYCYLLFFLLLHYILLHFYFQIYHKKNLNNFNFVSPIK